MPAQMDRGDYLKIPDVEGIGHVFLGEIEGAKDLCGEEGEEKEECGGREGEGRRG